MTVADGDGTIVDSAENSEIRALLYFGKVWTDGSEGLFERLSRKGIRVVIAPGRRFETARGISFLPIGAGLEAWLEVALNESGAREYARFERSPSFGQLKSKLVIMQNRIDMTGTYRLLDREIEIRQILLGVFSVLAVERPHVAIFNVTPHDHVLAAIEGALRWLNIPILHFQPSLLGPQSIPRLSLTQTFPYSLPQSIRSRYLDELSDIKSLALSSILRLEGGGGTAKLSSQYVREKQARSIEGRIRAIAYTAVKVFRRRSTDGTSFTGHRTLPSWFAHLLHLILEWSLRRSLLSAIAELRPYVEKGGGKFAVFALHYEPERCSIPEGHPFDLQIDAVIRARALLPEDTVLLVKEHFSQSAAALRGHLGRSPATYKLLESIPGVQMLGVSANLAQIIPKSECVFTLTGKVGIEAALKGTPVVFGGQPWWEGMPGSASLSQFENTGHLTEFLAKTRPSRKEVFAWLEDQITNRLLPVLGDGTVARYSERISPLPSRFLSLQRDVLVDVIQAFVRRRDEN